jgi:hypothetical protein
MHWLPGNKFEEMELMLQKFLLLLFLSGQDWRIRPENKIVSQIVKTEVGLPIR